MDDGAHLTIEVVADSGEPMQPKKNAKTFVNQCGVIVRDNVPINIQEWNEPKKQDGVSYVSDRYKDALWAKLSSYFTLPVLENEEKTEELMLRVKYFALRKMATQFNKFKNRLWAEYVKAEKKDPTEWKGPLVKQRAHWPKFLEMKKLEVFKQRSAKNKENAAKNKYHHTMGTGGYKKSVPKWDKIEDAMLAQGIIPETQEWATRHINWVLGHRGEYNMQT